MTDTFTPSPHASPRRRGTLAAALALALNGCGNDAAGGGGPDDSAIGANPAARVVDGASPGDGSIVGSSTGPVTLDVRVTLWSSERLELVYAVGNGTPDDIVLFDGAPGDTYGGFDRRGVVEVLEEDGRIVLFKGAVFRDDCLNPIVPITVGGDPLASGERSNGVVEVALPPTSACDGPPAETDPATLDVCVGYVPAADPALAPALAGGLATTGEPDRYQVGLLPPQRRGCVTLTR